MGANSKIPASDLEALTEPVFSASIYAAGQLDALIADAVTPFSRDLTAADSDAFLWVVRYSRRGEHLKVRVHSGSLDAEAVETFLQKRLEPFFRGLPEAEEERAVRFDVPAIDDEDEGGEAVPDRTYRVTRYRRSHVTLGAPEVFENDQTVALMHRALGAGFARCLGLDAQRLAAQRQNLPAKGFLDAVLHALDRPTAGRYLEYHGDWLLRFFVPDAGREQDLEGIFAERIRKMSPMVEKLAEIDPSGDIEDPWIQSIQDLIRHAKSLSKASGFDPDPFADAPWQPILFKVLHGVSNTFGVRPMDEAFVCRLLAAALRLRTAGAGA